MIKELRERTAAGMADCKKALVETSGDMDKAVDFLRKKGLAKAAKKAGRVATEGLISQYIHGNGRIGVLLETNCETDFVARNDDFIAFTRDVSMQIAAMNPQFVSDDELSTDFLAKEKEIRMATARETGKPEKMLEKIVDGQLKKWKKEICLLDQPWVKDDKKTIRDLQSELVAKLGENIKVRRFVRFEVGEGLEKKTENFAEEVATPLGLDFWIGLPESEEPRVSRLENSPPPTDPQVVAMLEMFMGPGTNGYRALTLDGRIDGIGDEENPFNTRAVHATEMPAANGITNASSLARMYAATIGDVDGVRLIDHDTMQAARTERVNGPDLTLIMPTRIAAGFWLQNDLSPMIQEGSFGHAGAGGSLGYANPELGIGYGYVMNQMGGGIAGDPRTIGLNDAVLASL